jgi:sec-independent protein translocase protein TatC
MAEEDPRVREDERADLISHLSELRARVLRAVLYTAAGAAIVWVFFDQLYRFLVGPIRKPLEEVGGELMVYEVVEPLMVRLSIVLVGGVILALPFVFYELWAFVAPGLTASERKAVRPLAPVSGLLFLMGVALGYLITETAVRALLSFNPPETEVRLSLNRTLLLLLKFYLAFGLGFQLPIVIVILAKLGIVDSMMLIRRWREAVVAIFVLAALITPTWDFITLTIAAVPMVLLYMLTIGAVKLIERGERKRREGEGQLAG